MSGGDSVTATAPPARENELRAGTWNLLGNLLAGPPAGEVLELLGGIRDPASERERDEIANAWAALRIAAQRVVPAGLEQEYQDVFIGVGGGEITPYASWYETGSLLERPLIELRQDLQLIGIERQDGVSEPEDHAAAVCEVMSVVINDPDIGFDWEKQFFERHIHPWMGRLFRDLQEAPSAGFYRAVGSLGEAFVRLEQRYFAMPA